MVRSYDSKREPRRAPAMRATRQAGQGQAYTYREKAPWHEFTLRDDLGQQRPD